MVLLATVGAEALDWQLGVAAGLLVLAYSLAVVPLFKRRLGYSFEVSIGADPAVVFDAIADVRRWPQDQPDAIEEILAIQGEPLRAGSVITYRFRVGGKTMVGSDSVVACERGRVFWLRAVGKPVGGEVYTLSAEGEGTHLHYEWSTVRRIPLVTLGRLGRHLGRRRLRKQLLMDVLKARVEALAAATN